MGVPTWDEADVTYGQAQTAQHLHRSYVDNEGKWPCSTRLCLHCNARMPAGYTVCVACHYPFVFVAALMGGAPRSIRTPAMAAKVVTPGFIAPNASPQRMKDVSSRQIAKAVLGSRAFRSASSDANTVVKR
eukprot:9403838-Heterocapsa_arctica.AAC.1